MKRERSDPELAKALASGDETALEELYDRYGGEAYSLAYRLLGSADDAEDVVQEMFLALHRKPDSYRGEAKFTTWMYRVIMNRGRNVMKKRSRERARIRKLREMAPEPGAEPEEDLSEQAARVRDAVGELPEAQREVLVLTKYQEKSYEEAGEILGISADAVKMRVHRAVQALRQKFGG